MDIVRLGQHVKYWHVGTRLQTIQFSVTFQSSSNILVQAVTFTAQIEYTDLFIASKNAFVYHNTRCELGKFVSNEQAVNRIGQFVL